MIEMTPNEEKQDTAANPDNNDVEYSETAFFPVSENKLITMYISSFGFYGIYWFYKNWKLQEKTMDKKIYPLWRAIFAIFFTHSLFKRINQQASHLDKQHRFNAIFYATLFVVAIIASNVLDHLYGNIQITGQISDNTIIIISLALLVLSVFPLLKAQATVNRINDDILGYLNYRYSLPNYILITAGSVLWLLIILGLIVDHAGIVTPV
jgi:hypothetical protein